MFLLDTIPLGRYMEKLLYLSFKNLNKEKEYRFFWHEGVNTTLLVI